MCAVYVLCAYKAFCIPNTTTVFYGTLLDVADWVSTGATAAAAAEAGHASSSACSMVCINVMADSLTAIRCSAFKTNCCPCFDPKHSTTLCNEELSNL